MISSSVCVCVCAQLLSRGWPCEIPWTAGHQWLLSMEFSRQEYWIRMSFPPLGHLPNPGTEPKSLMSPALAGRFFTTEQSGKSIIAFDLKTILLQISKIRYYCCIYIYIYIYTHTHTHTHESIRKVKWHVKYHIINFWFEQYQNLSLLILLLSHCLLKAYTILKSLWRLVYESHTKFGSKIIFFKPHILDMII